MKNTQKFIGFAVIAAIALAMTACDQPTDSPSGSVAVTGVTLNQNSLSLAAGNSATLTATVLPSNASNKNVSWISSNNGVATVSNGSVTAVAAGSATITVTTADGGYTATCAVTVGSGQGGNGGKLTVSNLTDGGTYAVYVFASGTDISTFTAITSALTSQNFQAVGASPSGNVFDLYGWNGTATTTGWTGSGSLPVLLLNASGNTTGTANPMYSWATITFTNGNGAANFSNFTAVEGGGGIIIPGTGSKLTIDGLPSGGTYTYAVYIFSSGTDISTYQAILTAYTSFSYQAVGAAVTNGNAFTLVGWNGTATTTAWKGTGSLPVLLLNAKGSITETDNPMYSWATVDFNEGTGTVNFSGFTAVVTGGGGGNQNPTADDFNIGNLSQIPSSVTAVTITPKEGKSTGSITVYYNGSTTIPQTAGTYTVTFDVGASTGWNTASGLSGGTLRVVNATINNVSDLAAYLSSQSANTPETPFYIALTINNTSDFTTLYTTLRGATNKYVYLDLSGSAITTIPDNAFYTGTSWDGTVLACTTLTGITIPNSVTSIGSQTFRGCNKLTSLTLPTNVNFTSIGQDAFYGCISLTSITIPASVTNLGVCAFESCSFTSVIIPASVTNIAMYAFSNCSSLTSVTFATGSDISYYNFGNEVFPEGSSGAGGNNLQTVYLAANPKAGTYTRAANGSTWTKK